MTKQIYLDNAATTPVCAPARRALEEALDEFGNPSSPHGAGTRARRMLEDARAAVAALARCSPEELLFTATGTEANNIALHSHALRRRSGRILTTESEHPSVYEPLRALEQAGREVVRIACRGGVPDYDALEASLDGSEAVVAVMQGNNETGALYDIERIRALLQKHRSRALLHVDAVQSFGKLPPAQASVVARCADTAAFSAHKIGGVKGAAALFVRRGLTLTPLLYGGGQERGLRPGTESLPAVAAFGAACADIGRPESRAALSAAYAAVCAALSGIARLHIPPEHLESVLLVSVPGYKSETAVNWLAEKGICLSASSACSTKKKTHRVLADFGLSPEDAESALRVGISRFTTAEEAKALAEALTQMKTEVRRCR